MPKTELLISVENRTTPAQKLGEAAAQGPSKDVQMSEALVARMSALGMLLDRLLSASPTTPTGSGPTNEGAD